MRRRLLGLAALAALAAAAAWIAAPPARLALTTTFDDGTVRGALHVHSTRSDGIGTPEAIARAAADAGLAFVVLTDHGDATREPDPPAYVDGVLLLDGVEISTTGGHYIALDMPAAPYPLGGEARDVVEDVARLGGFGIVAHPDSPKSALAWHDWRLPFDGIEIVNLDTAWRRRVAEPGVGAKARLLVELLGAFVRAPETMARLATPGSTLERWTSEAAGRHVVMTAGTDAHGGLTLGDDSKGGGVLPLPLPGYAAAFRAMSVHVRPARPLTGDADDDAASLFQAMRAGQLYVAMDGLAAPAAFELTAVSQMGEARVGERLLPGGPLTLHVRSNAPADYSTEIWHDDARVGEPRREQAFQVETDGAPGTYWALIRAPGGDGADRPWLLSNAIEVRVPTPPESAAPAPPATAVAMPLFETIADAATWWTETDPTSVAAVDPAEGSEGPELRFRWGLPGARGQQYAALVGESPSGTLAGDRLAFEARSEEPMRISVQLRVYQPDNQGPRWQRSIYLDPEWTAYDLPISDFSPPADAASATVPPEGFRSVMFVVTLMNTPPGASGRVWIRHVRTY